jgi:dolichyl-phosphate-mannose-protein mannosyltransferase
VRSPRWGRHDWLALSLVTATAALLRLARLGEPAGIVFDETYYARDACWYVHASAGLCGAEVEPVQVHPPLGKWLIAAGIRAFGYDAFGWRIAAALAGAATVALLFVLGRKLQGSTRAGLVAAMLLCFDFLHFVQSRIAMLDVFVALFGVAAALAMVLDKQGNPHPPGDDAPPRRLLRRPWRLAAGAAAGAAAASKWSGLLVVVMVIGLGVTWDLSARRKQSPRRTLREFLFRDAPALVAHLVVVPALVYALSYIARLDGAVVALPWQQGSWWRALWDRQQYMLEFHRGLEATHPYSSAPWSWPLIKRPVSYYFETAPNGDYMEIFATGNPLVWWPSLAALLYVAVAWVRRRGAATAEGVVLSGFAFNYLPWVAISGPRSAVFLFYLLPAVPFMCLALALVVERLAARRRVGAALALAALALVASFTFYYPLLSKVPLPREAWLRRIWVFDQCDRPAAPDPTRAATSGSPGGTGAASPAAAADVEPEGWCWI